MKKIAILTSGGDAPGMNAAIRGILRMAIFLNLEVCGVYQGYQGLLEEEFINMTSFMAGGIIHRGGTILKTARCALFTSDSIQKKAVGILKARHVDSVIVIGGDGSLKGAAALSRQGIPTITIPATIDNDMGYTDYTIGFFTSVNTVIDAISKLRDTSSSHGRANILEVMGRKCGDIALNSGLAGGAESIIVPEVDFDIDKVCNKIVSGRKRGKLHHIIVLTEGILSPYELKRQIQEKTKIDTRVTVLGHIQRGGTPSSFDRIIASQMGSMAVKLLLKDKTNLALAFRNNSIEYIFIEDAVSSKKIFNKNLYDIVDELSI